MKRWTEGGPNLLRKKLLQIVKPFKFKSVSGRIEEKHGSLLPNLPFKTNIGIDHELDSCFHETAPQFSPLGHRQDNPEVGNRDIMAIDRIVMR